MASLKSITELNVVRLLYPTTDPPTILDTIYTRGQVSSRHLLDWQTALESWILDTEEILLVRLIVCQTIILSTGLSVSFKFARRH